MLENMLPTYLVSLQKLIIDEKKFYLFGRNPDLCDFTIDHQSCSRVHAALVYHKHLKRLFLIDLNSSKLQATEATSIQSNHDELKKFEIVILYL